jgi:hypothetical protein
LFAYWVKPSTAGDSRAYHFESITWYEQFKVVPGLGNLHGRFAFNPVSFIIQSAYSFTGLLGRSVYSLNGVLTCLFLLWLFARLLRYRRSVAGLVYFALLAILGRYLLGYMSSPSSDTLLLICIAYPALKLFEMLGARTSTHSGITLASTITPLFILLFAPVAKLSAYPVLPLILYILYLLPPADKKPSMLIPLLAIMACLYIPWMGRNYIMSGYLAYPLPFTDLFHPDWQVPPDMLLIDYDFAKYGPRSMTNAYSEFRHIQSTPFMEWFIPLLAFKFTIKAYIELVLLFSGILLAPLIWIILYTRGPKPAYRQFICWLFIYAGTLFWFYTSLDLRIGLVFLVLSVLFPLLAYTTGRQVAGNKMPKALIPALMVIFTLYYIYADYTLYKEYYNMRGQGFQLTEGWVFPLRDAMTYPAHIKDGFPYKVLNKGVRLYISGDGIHYCINTCLPCMIHGYGWNNAEVEMRGDRLDQGFRTAKVIPLPQ